MKKVLLKMITSLLLISFVVIGLSNQDNTNNYELLTQIGLAYVALKVSFYLALSASKIEYFFRVNLLKVQ